MQDAGEALQSGDAERAIRVVEQYLLENRTDAEIDGLLEEARQALSEQHLRLRVAEFSRGKRELYSVKGVSKKLPPYCDRS